MSEAQGSDAGPSQEVPGFWRVAWTHLEDTLASELASPPRYATAATWCIQGPPRCAQVVHTHHHPTPRLPRQQPLEAS